MACHNHGKQAYSKGNPGTSSSTCPQASLGAATRTAHNASNFSNNEQTARRIDGVHVEVNGEHRGGLGPENEFREYCPRNHSSRPAYEQVGDYAGDGPTLRRQCINQICRALLDSAIEGMLHFSHARPRWQAVVEAYDLKIVGRSLMQDMGGGLKLDLEASFSVTLFSEEFSIGKPLKVGKILHHHFMKQWACCIRTIVRAKAFCGYGCCPEESLSVQCQVALFQLITIGLFMLQSLDGGWQFHKPMQVPTWRTLPGPSSVKRESQKRRHLQKFSKKRIRQIKMRCIETNSFPYPMSEPPFPPQIASFRPGPLEYDSPTREMRESEREVQLSYIRMQSICKTLL